MAQNLNLELTRRELFRTGGMGLGASALMSLLGQDAYSVESPFVNPLRAKQSDYQARAKNVIYIHKIGAPSQLDLYVV